MVQCGDLIITFSEKANTFNNTKKNTNTNFIGGNIFRSYETTCKLATEINETLINDYQETDTPCQRCLINSTLTSSTFSDFDDDNDYGLYEDLEDDFNINLTTETLDMISTPLSSEGNASNLVIYTVQNNYAHVSCRSFEKKMDKTSSVCISMTGERIVQDSSGVHAEYHVKMVNGSVEYNIWKTFNDFQEIAKACREVSNIKKSIWPSIFTVSIAKRRRCQRNRRSIRLRKTLLAWDYVIHERSKRNWFKQLSGSSLVAEANDLQIFLECLLFEIPDIEILVEFLASD